MKKNSIIVLLILCIIALVVYIEFNGKESQNNESKNNNSDVQIQDNYSIETETPIDSYYKEKLDMELPTVEINYIADSYMNSWKNEFENVVKIIKEKLKYEEDKEKFDRYYQVYQQLTECVQEIEYLKYVDVTESPNERFAGTASSYGSILAMTNVYKQATINLITYYEDFTTEGSYKYIFRGEM